MVDMAGIHRSSHGLHLGFKSQWHPHCFHHWHRSSDRSLGHSWYQEKSFYGRKTCTSLIHVLTNFSGHLLETSECAYFGLDRCALHRLFIILLRSFRYSHTLWSRRLIHESCIPRNLAGQWDAPQQSRWSSLSLSRLSGQSNHDLPEIRYYDTVVMRHKQTKIYLHSHVERYPLSYEDGRISSQG